MTEDLAERHDCLIKHYCEAVGSRLFEKKALQKISVLLFSSDGLVQSFTVGMSDRVQPRNPSLDREIRAEIYCPFQEKYRTQALELVESIASYPHAVRTHLHWGHSLQLGNSISGCCVKGVLITMPPFRAELMSASCAGFRIDLLRVVPLVGGEFQLVKEIGPDRFEELLENGGADVADFDRNAVSL